MTDLEYCDLTDSVSLFEDKMLLVILCLCLTILLTVLLVLHAAAESQLEHGAVFIVCAALTLLNTILCAYLRFLHIIKQDRDDALFILSFFIGLFAACTGISSIWGFIAEPKINSRPLYVVSFVNFIAVTSFLGTGILAAIGTCLWHLLIHPCLDQQNVILIKNNVQSYIDCLKRSKIAAVEHVQRIRIERACQTEQHYIKVNQHEDDLLEWCNSEGSTPTEPAELSLSIQTSK